MTTGDLMTLASLVLLVMFSAYFSATETAFSSLNLIRVRNRAEGGEKCAALVVKLVNDYDKLLSTILVGNNIVNLSAASIATVFFVKHFGAVGATVSTVVITIVVLIFGEISPKSLAKDSPERFAMFSAPLLQVLMIILTPVNWLFTQWKRLLSVLFKSKSNRNITEEELLTMVDEAHREGAIEEQDKELIRNAIEFNDLHVGDILTPRIDIAAVPEDATPEEVERCFLETGYSRIIVYDATLDNIIGVLHLYDFLACLKPSKKPLRELLTPPLFVVPSTRISNLLKLFQSQKTHMAVVMDEYGGTMGIITLEDILEELVGEIWDEHDEMVQPFTRLNDDTYKVLCSVEIGKMFQYFGLRKNEEETEDVTTVSGWIAKQLGKIPEVGDGFTYQNLRVTVQAVLHRRAEECVVSLTQTQPPKQNTQEDS